MNSRGGYGAGYDLKKIYDADPNVTFDAKPHWKDFVRALTSGKYDVVIYHTHGGVEGLEFIDAVHSLSELQGIQIATSVDVVGISSCFPSVQEDAWKALGNGVKYADLSVTGKFSNPNISHRLHAINKIARFVY